MNFNHTILLTGAGFTANFNGFLAREMWSWIFNNPKLNNAGNIKYKLRDKFNFEEIYSEVFDTRGSFPQHEVNIFKEIVDEAYISMDKVIQSSWDSLAVHHGDLTVFLNKVVAPSADGAGVCFTLNQDLMMEKRFGWRPLAPQSMNYQGNWGEVDNEDLNSYSTKQLPTNEELNEYKSNLGRPHASYIKLHGSLRWTNSTGDDNKVIGINKVDTIARIPLLNWYFQLFKKAIVVGNAKLITIGYGFRDTHINELLASACEENQLKLYIISPQNPEIFKENLLYRGQGVIKDADIIGSKIWKGVAGYFPYELKDLFSHQQKNINPELTALYESIGI